MAAQWFFQLGQREIGPVSATQVRELVKAGKITPTTLIRKSDSDWAEASRIKGLFDSSSVTDNESPEQERDPLISMATNAATSVVSAAGSAASAVGGVVAGLLTRGPVNQTGDLPEMSADKGWLDVFTRDEQSPEVVEKVIERLRAIMMSGEQIKYVAVQNKPIINLVPDCIVVTNKRFIFYRPKLLGRVDFEDYVWRDLHDARLSENIIGSTISIKTTDGRTISLDYLPKSQARAVYRLIQEIEESSLEERRSRWLEEKRAAAGGVTVQTQFAIPAPAADVDRQIVTQAADPVQTLQKLKTMLDAGLITQAEYDAKKTDILSRM